MNGKARVIAAEDILPGCLRIPAFCRNDSNYSTPSHPVQGNFHEVIGEVVWIDEKTGHQDKKIQISCQPERRLPKTGDRKPKASDYNDKTDLYPFWHIKRSPNVNEFNCEVIQVWGRTVNQADMKQLQSDDNALPLQVNAVNTSVLFVVNPKKIETGVELYFEMGKSRNPQKRKSRQTCHDCLRPLFTNYEKRKQRRV